MRSLSEVETRLIATLLESRPETQREWIADAGMARSTFQYARTRAYARGWVYDRYVPHPSLGGIRRLAVLVVRPFVGRRKALAAAWVRPPEVALAWTAPNLSVAVLGLRDECNDLAEIARRLSLDPRELEAGAIVPADNDHLPAYFDFLGALGRLFDLEGRRTYPIPLVRPTSSGPATPPDPSSASAAAAHRLLESVGSGDRGWLGRAAPPVPWTLPRDQARLVEQGWLHWRVLPDLRRLPMGPRGAPSTLVVAHGRARPHVSGPFLVRGLVAECGVFPFLVATESEGARRTLIGFLGRAPGMPPIPKSNARSSTSAWLGSYVEGLKVVREPIATVTPLVDHRYAGWLAR